MPRRPPVLNSNDPIADERVIREPAGRGRDEYLPLFRLADDSESQIRAYYQTGELFVFTSTAAPLGMVLVTPHGKGQVELKSVAVVEHRQNAGIGTRMIAAVLSTLDARGVRRVVVATASSSIGPFAFYQKAGFRLTHVERDYFSPVNGYSPGLEEHGIPVRDRVWLERTR